MNKILVIVLSFSFLNAFAQVTDDFTDGDFTSTPTWAGSTALFTVTSGELQSQSPTAASFYLSTPSTLATSGQWEFLYNFKYSTSGVNYVDAYLVSDNADLTAANNGYFVRLGGTDDEISLYRKLAGTDTLLIDGADGLINSSSDNPFRIKVTRDASNNWALSYDDLGSSPSGGYVSGGSAVDAAVNSSTHFGFLIVQSSAGSAVNAHYLDEVDVKVIVPDVTAPTISSVTVLTTTTLDVLFDEIVDKATAETVTNYGIDGGIGTPLTATQDASNKALVHLTLSNTMTNGSSYVITIVNVEDVLSNAITTETKSFTYFIPSYKDVVINEIFADPTPIIGLPSQEYIELHNTSSSSIELNGWEFTDGGTPAVFGSKTLAAGGYLIVCASANIDTFTTYGDVLGVSSFPALNNGGDDLELSNSLGTIIDEVPYTSSWYNDATKDDGGYSLELIDASFPCVNSSNWSASNDASGGTPGTVNSVAGTIVDTDAPVLSSVSLSPDSVVTLSFDEQLDASSVSKTNFSVDGGLTIDSVILLSDNSSIKVTFTSNISVNQLYELTYSSLKDCIGNALGQSVAQFGKGIQPPTSGAVIINELYPDESPSEGLPIAEFVEIYNLTTDLLDISGMVLTDFNDSLTIGSYTLLPNSYLIFSSSEDYALFGNLYKSSSVPGLNNSGETIAFLNSDQTIHSSVTYNTDFYKNEDKDDGGWSIELKNSDNVCGANYEANWGASIDSAGGTPGKVNSLVGSLVDVTNPEIVRAVATSSTNVDVYFSESINEATLNLNNYSVNNGITVVSRSLSNGFDIDHITLGVPLEPKTLYTLTLIDFFDCFGRVVGDADHVQFGLPELMDSNDIIINEVLFNAKSGGKDFVELYNNSDKFIDLKDLYIIENKDGAYKDYELSTENLVIAPNDYAVFCEGPTYVIVDYPNGVAKNIFETDLPSYSDSEGEVLIGFVNGSSFTVTDSMGYDKDMHYELIDDVNGVSLERISPDLPANDENSWHSAASSVGYATPGYLNSQNLDVQLAEDNFKIDPEVFTPDEDGDKDFTIISYAFSEPGYVASITIYDTYGRLVRNLVRNELLATEGIYQWDGKNEENRKALVGNYIVLFEVFNVEGDRENFKKIVTVGAQLNR